MKIRSGLGYSLAALTLLAAVLVPFALMTFFTRAVARAGLHIDERYAAGPVVRTIEKTGYRIQVHKEFHPRLWQRAEAYVQIVWEPAAALPPRIVDEVDIDGDGAPDVRVSFAVPVPTGATVEVEPLNPKYLALHAVGQQSLSRMIAQAKDKVIVRIPLRR